MQALAAAESLRAAGSRESRRAVHDCGEPALLEAHSRGAGDACGIGEAPSGVQPIVPGARPLPCGAAPRRACHPSLPACGHSQFVAFRELECPRGAVPHGGTARRRARTPQTRSRSSRICPGNPLPPSACSRTARSTAAEQVVRQYLLTHGDHIEGMRLLAQIGMKLDVTDDAEFLLENVLAAGAGLSCRAL